jgi:hypothetical protein
MLVTTGDKDFPIAIPFFAGRIHLQTGSTWILRRCPVVPSHLQLAKVSVLGRKDLY